jgi:hypothetical protein
MLSDFRTALGARKETTLTIAPPPASNACQPFPPLPSRYTLMSTVDPSGIVSKSG